MIYLYSALSAFQKSEFVGYVTSSLDDDDDVPGTVCCGGGV